MYVYVGTDFNIYFSSGEHICSLCSNDPVIIGETLGRTFPYILLREKEESWYICASVVQGTTLNAFWQ